MYGVIAKSLKYSAVFKKTRKLCMPEMHRCSKTEVEKKPQENVENLDVAMYEVLYVFKCDVK